MQKIYVQQPSLLAALKGCETYNEVCTSGKLSDKENIHCYKGVFYCEDGVMIGENLDMAYRLLSKMKWIEKASWFLIGRFSNEDLKRLEFFHKNIRKHPAGWFGEEYRKLMGGGMEVSGL